MIDARDGPRAAAPAFTRSDRRRALKVSVAEGLVAQLHASLTGLGMGGNAFTYAYALLLGASNTALGFVAALPQLGTASQLLSAYALQRLPRRKGLVIAGATAGRLLFLAIPVLPFVLARGPALALFLVLWGLGNVLASVAGNAWTSWMSDVIPRSMRGRYMSWRNTLAGLGGMVVFLTAGILLDARAGAPPGASPEADARRLAGFGIVFATACAAALLSAFMLAVQPEPPRRAPAGDGAPGTPLAPLALIRLPFADPAFRRLLLFFAVFSAVNGIGNPFWTPYTVEDLGGDYSFLTTLNVVGGLAGLLALRLWGRAIDRFGSRPIIAVAVLFTALHPLYYFASARGFLAPLFIDAVSSGVFWGGFNLAVFSLLLGLAPERGREMYYAVFAATAGLAMAASSVVAGAVAEAVEPVAAFGRTFNGREVLFASVCALRLACLPLVLRLAEPRARDVRFVVQSVFQLFRGRLTPGGPLAASGRGGRPSR